MLDGSEDYCCPHDPSDPDEPFDYCMDENDEYLGIECQRHWIKGNSRYCEDHPSVIKGERKSFEILNYLNYTIQSI